MRILDSENRAELLFIRVLLPFSAGIVVIYHHPIPKLLSCLILVITVLFGCLFAVNLWYKHFNILRYKRSAGLLLHILIFLIGCLHATLYNESLNSDYYVFKNYNYLKIKIINEPKKKPNIILFDAIVTKGYVLDTTSVPAHNYRSQQTSGKIRLAIIPDTISVIPLKYGDELIIPVGLSEIEPPGNPSEFDFKSWLAAQNIYHQSFLKQGELIKTKADQGNKLIAYALQLREQQVAFYRKLLKNDDAFAVAATLVLGYRSDLSAETLDVYAKTGTIHILSVSGMHVGLIYMILNWLLSFIDSKHFLKLLKTLLIVVLIWAYSLLTGFSPSVLRSAIMISVFIIAKLFAKTTNSYNIIAFAAFSLLVYNPFLIWDVGFQLSFLAVFGLIYLQPKIYAWLRVENRWLDKLWSAVAISIAAQLATYPLSIYYFHQFPLYFLISNLFMMIPAALTMYLGIFILLFRIDCLGALFEGLIVFMNTGLNKIAALPFSGISAIWISKTELVLLSFTLIFFITAMQGLRKRLLMVSLALFLALQSFIACDKLRAFHQKKTIRFNLKKNYATALLSSHKAILFTDLNPASKEFKYFVKPALDQHRITQIIFRAAIP
jgi:competence protein ComEC